MSDLTPQQKRQIQKQEFKRKFQKYWLVYVALICTSILSAISGFLLPSEAKDGIIKITVITFFAGIYYAAGFLTNGEGAAYFWFDKLTDHDPDNTKQIWIASIMLGVSVLTIVITASAAASFLAYAIGALSEFQIMPRWAQVWVVWAIPVLWVVNLAAGMAFRSLSDEAEAERIANAKIREIQQNISFNKANAKAEYWQKNAPDLARQLGELEAQDEIDNMKVHIKSKSRPNS